MTRADAVRVARRRFMADLVPFEDPMNAYVGYNAGMAYPSDLRLSSIERSLNRLGLTPAELAEELDGIAQIEARHDPFAFPPDAHYEADLVRECFFLSERETPQARLRWTT